MPDASVQLPLVPPANDGEFPRAELRDPVATVRFMLAGQAYVTFQSEKTGARFTYRIANIESGPAVSRDPVTHFVSVLTSPDRYEYLGCIYQIGRAYRHGLKSKINPDAPSAQAFSWVWRNLIMGRMHVELSIYHEGKCGRCGRRLTTPESIRSGIGPICGGRDV